MNLKKSILIHDEDLAFLKIATRKLEERGFIVKTSSSAVESIRILQELDCDSLLVNITRADERNSLFEYIETLDSKPVILFSHCPVEVKASINY